MRISSGMRRGAFAKCALLQGLALPRLGQRKSPEIRVELRHGRSAFADGEYGTPDGLHTSPAEREHVRDRHLVQVGLRFLRPRGAFRCEGMCGLYMRRKSSKKISRS